MKSGAPRVTVWIPYVLLAVWVLMGLLVQWLLPDHGPGFWMSLLGLAATYVAMRTALRWLFARCGLD